MLVIIRLTSCRVGGELIRGLKLIIKQQQLTCCEPSISLITSTSFRNRSDSLSVESRPRSIKLQRVSSTVTHQL